MSENDIYILVGVAIGIIGFIVGLITGVKVSESIHLKRCSRCIYVKGE